MGGLLHLVQVEGTRWDAAPPSPLLAVPNITAHPSTASVPITALLYMVRCSAIYVAIKWLMILCPTGYVQHSLQRGHYIFVHFVRPVVRPVPARWPYGRVHSCANMYSPAGRASPLYRCCCGDIKRSLVVFSKKESSEWLTDLQNSPQFTQFLRQHCVRHYTRQTITNKRYLRASHKLARSFHITKPT